MKRRRGAMTVSLSPEIAEDYEKMAKQEAKNKVFNPIYDETVKTP
jgi:hypothetical protein